MRPVPEVYCLGVPAIDKSDLPMVEVKSRIAEGSKDAKTDELLRHVAMDQPDNLFRCRQRGLGR